MDLNFNFDAHAKHNDAILRREMLDAGTAAVAGRLLRYTMAEVMTYKYLPDLWANEEVITFDSSVPVGAQSVDWYMKSDVAPADDGWLAANAPIPFADIATEQQNNKVIGRLDGFRYDVGEVEAYGYSGMGSIATDKAASCKRNWSNQMNTAILSGLAGKFTGVLNHPGALQLVAGTTANTTAAWASTATPEQINDTFEALWMSIRDKTGGLIIPDTVVMPSNLQGVWRRQKSLTDTTIGQWIERQFPQVTKWIWDARLDTAGIGSTSAIVLLARGREYITALTPMTMRPLPIKIEHQNTEQGFRSTYAGLKVPYAGSIAVLSGVS